jgi:hypothetical protein
MPVSVCVSPIVVTQRLGKSPPIVARQRLGKNVTAVKNSQATIEELLGASFSTWPVSYQGKQEIGSSQNFLFYTCFLQVNSILVKVSFCHCRQHVASFLRRSVCGRYYSISVLDKFTSSWKLITPEVFQWAQFFFLLAYLTTFLKLKTSTPQSTNQRDVARTASCRYHPERVIVLNPRATFSGFQPRVLQGKSYIELLRLRVLVPANKIRINVNLPERRPE